MKTGLSLIDAIHYPPTVPECRTRQDCYACPIEQCSQAVRTHEAVRLIQAGARTTLGPVGYHSHCCRAQAGSHGCLGGSTLWMRTWGMAV